jgi:hypothetical protein
MRVRILRSIATKDLSCARTRPKPELISWPSAEGAFPKSFISNTYEGVHKR